jgi:hypothetical protein
MAVDTPGVHGPGVPPAFGTDHHTTFFDTSLAAR